MASKTTRNNVAVVCVCALVFTGCSTLSPVTPPITVIDAPKPSVVYQRPDPVSLLPLTWRVLGEGDGPDAVAILEKDALVCLTPKGYEALAKNMAELRRYLNQLKALVESYEKERLEQ